MSWNIQTPGDYINGPLTVAGVASFQSNVGIGIAIPSYRLDVSSATASNQLRISGSNQNSITLGNAAGTGGTGFLVGRSFSSDNANNFFIFDIAASALRLFIGDTGNVGMGTPAPSAKQHVLMPDAATADLARFQQTNQGNLLIQSQQGSQNLGGANGILFSNATGRMGFRTNASSGDAQVLLDTGGNLLVGLVANNANGGCLQLKSGISLPATQVASTDANTLDDYEEGTWTGTLRGLTSDPTVAVTATGQYTKIGRKVTVRISFEGVTNTGASGDCFINGLPFANGNVRTPGSAGSYAAMTYTGTLISLIDGSSTNINFIDSRSNAAWAGAAHYPGSGRTICAEVTYNV